jgi:hypothetical protein
MAFRCMCISDLGYFSLQMRGGKCIAESTIDQKLNRSAAAVERRPADNPRSLCAGTTSLGRASPADIHRQAGVLGGQMVPRQLVEATSDITLVLDHHQQEDWEHIA